MSELGLRFLFSCLFLTLMIGVILGIKKLFRRHLTVQSHYRIWYLFLFLLLLPFVPVKGSDFALYSWVSRSIPSASTISGTLNAAGQQTGTPFWLPDYALPAKQSGFPWVNALLLVLWLLGMSSMLGYTIYSNLRLYRLIKASLPIQNGKIRRLYQECMREIGLHREIPLYSSAFLRSPISAGFFRPRILLPIPLLQEANEADIRFILLHELQHLRQKDHAVSLLLCLAQIVYWFHPAVWYALRQMRDDRELACDAAVLNLLDNDSRKTYGMTLLKYTQTFSQTAFTSAAGIAGTKKQIEKRILGIVSYRREPPLAKVKSLVILAFTGVLLLSSAPVLSVRADTKPQSHSYANEAALDLDSYFRGYEGSFVLYDKKEDCWSVYHEKAAAKRYSPDSTYKIYSGLIALEEGVITPETSTLSWDGTPYPFDSWNQDQNLDTAMKNSVNWYFQTLDGQTGKEALSRYLRRIGYGNEDLSGGLSDFWMESSLKISPAEQVDLLVKLYENEFGFSEAAVEGVKSSMLLTSQEGCRVYGKTGTGNVEGKNRNGWFIGFVEKNDTAYFFAANLQADQQADGSTAAEISLDVLRALDILPQ